MSSLFLSVMMMVSAGCSSNSGDVPLVTAGKSAYTIVTPVSPSKAESKAAGIVQEYILQVSGAKLPIMQESNFDGRQAIYVGNTKHTSGPVSIKDDGYYTGVAEQSLYIRGGSGKGVIYGAYHFAEAYMHCRKLPGVQPVVPASRDIKVPAGMKDLSEPDFIYRESYYPASADPLYLEWHGLQRFEDLWGLWGHSYFKILPPKSYFATHPEYYSMVNGKRQPLQLCLSNEEVFKLTVAFFKQAIADNPDAIYWSISPEDGPGGCTCDQCKKADAEEGSQSGSLIRFVNRVAAVFPAQRFTTLAYGYTSKAPGKTRPADNVYVLLSTIDAYRQTPLQEAPSAAGFRKNLETWEKTGGHLFIWDYTTQFTNYLCPFPDYNNLAANLQYFAAHGVRGVFSQGSGDTYGDMAEYNSYLQAALLWNTKADAAAVSADFMKSYYKAAGGPMQQYVQALTAAVKSTNAVLDIYGSPIYSGRDYLSPANLDKYSNILDQAEAAAEKDTAALQRVYRARLPLEYTVLQQSRVYGTEKFGYLVPGNGNAYTVNPKWPARVQRFTAQAKAAGVTELSEGGLSPEAYQQQWQLLLQRPWVGGLAFRAPVTLVNPYTPEYSPMKEKTLTDGLTGDKDFSYNWLFTYGKDMIATVDLGGSKAVSSVQLNFLQDARHNIFLPVKIIIEISGDGKAYTKIGEQAGGLPKEEDYAVAIQHYQFKNNRKPARYIRVTATCAASMPEWRAIPNKLPAVCCDEVVVL
ncbi:protein of unknown function [Chitinophaga jiangningensis]|uniref:F5/8 type C domain-containing protein n=1 Tax=Chitinophaga jiangningensis TaxID=1419482 RepID=A0A1M7BR07_9BACT|nr:DUF4838 domain-containing protein [Chitinophaga jiangningensis]SHL57353.1 protein of unknown function [Chitinophaga jiangningensis]